LFPSFDWHAFSQLLPGGKVKFLFASWICDCCYSTAAVSSNHFSFPLIFIFLVKHEQETAISVFYSREDMIDQGYTTFGYLKMQMVVAHGGRCAERLVYGDDITDGGSDDLEKITKVNVVIRV
jgi:cell division protease FtsH